MNYEYYKISKKSSYAIRALFELALRNPAEPCNVRSLAKAQSIPVRFLEIILNELKQGGFVLSIRGKSGGYLLARPPKEIALGEIIRFFEKPAEIAAQPANKEIHPGVFVTGQIMRRINEFIGSTCDSMSLKDMVDEELKMHDAFASNYII